LPTLIDSLIVSLSLDSKDVDAKAPGVRSKLADLEKSASKTEKGFTGLSGAVESFGAVLTSIVSVGVVTAFAKDIIETNTHLYYLSQNLGISAQKLSAWGQMAKQLGGSSASIQNFFGQIRGMYGQYMMGGTPPLQKLFAMVGINPMAAAMQSPEATMLQLSEKFKNADTGPNRWKAASFMEAGGLSEDVVNMILQGPAWIKSHKQELTALSPTDRQVKASADLTQRLVVLSTAVNKIGNNLLTNLMPLLHKIEIKLDGILKWMLKHGGTTEAIAGTGVGALGLIGILGAFKMLKPLLGLLRPLIAGIGVAFTAIDWPILAVIGIIAALALGIYELHKHWSYFVEKWDKFKISPAMTEAAKLWGAVVDKMKSGEQWVISKWNEMQLKRAGMSGLAPGGGVHEQVSHKDLEKYLISKGMSPEWSAAWAANVQSESGGSTNARGDNGLAYGLAQFHPDWLVAFKQMYGIPMSQAGWKQQADFLTYISQNKMGKPGNLTEAQKAAYIVSHFEKPKDIAGESASRGSLAEQYYRGLSGASSVASGVSSTSNSSVTHSDSSKNVHIGTMNVNQPAAQGSSGSNSSHGMDWMFAPQFNGAIW
jgi:hypothetical protein